MKLTVLLPSRNEEQILKSTIDSISRYLKKKRYAWEIIVIVNGSSDSTKEIANTLSKINRRIKITTSKPGYGHALKHGLKRAKGQYIAIFNVDFFDLRLIDLVDIDLYGRDLLIGSKMAHWSIDDRPFQRKIVSYLFNRYLSFVHRFKGSDTHGIKLVRKSVIGTIIKDCRTSSGIFDTELVVRAQQAGFKLADFPVHVKEVRPPRFSNRLWQTPKDIFDLYRSLKFKSLKQKELFYDHLQPEWSEVLNKSETKKRLRLIFENLLLEPVSKDKSFLDAGCGLGFFTKQAIKKGYQVTGIDIGKKLVKHCQTTYPSANFKVSSAHKLPFKDNSFDVVLSTEVIEHLPLSKQQQVIKELARVLKPKGKLVLTTPNRLWLPVFRLLSFLQIRPYHGIENWYWPNQLIDQFSKAKLRGIKKLGFNITPLQNPFFDHLDFFLGKYFWFLGINICLVATKAKK